MTKATNPNFNIPSAEFLTVLERMDEMERGEFISEETMTKWFLSLGTNEELPEPQPDILVQR